MVVNGDQSSALDRLTSALALAEPAELYAAAWLTAACAPALRPHDPERITEFVRRYAPRVAELGYTEMARRYDSLALAG
jgi:hypothetical protein